MKIFSLTERNKNFVWYSTGLAIQDLAKLLGAELLQLEASAPMTAYWNLQEHGKSFDLIIIESAYLEILGLTIAKLRAYSPQAKIVCLNSDDIYFVVTKKNGGFQVPDLADADLVLTQMIECYDFYKDKIANLDYWCWTCSKQMLDMCKEYSTSIMQRLLSQEKKYDLIGVYSPHTIQRENSYRNQMVEHLESAGLYFTRGSGSGHNDNNIVQLMSFYAKSRFVLGTSSHDNPELKYCMKGYRDWSFLELDCLLLYDDNPNVRRAYPDCIPLYEYGHFDTIVDIIQYYSKYVDKYYDLLKKQQKWARNNTIEKQLFQLLIKYKIFPYESTNAYELEPIIRGLNEQNLVNNYGDVYEFGVYTGTSFKEIVAAFLKNKIKFITAHGFDSFEGLPEEQVNVQKLAQWKINEFDARKLRPRHYEQLQSELDDLYPNQCVLYKTWFKDLTTTKEMRPASFINIDCDLYISAYQALDFMFKNRLIKRGTIIRYDDIGGTNKTFGEQRAHNEIMTKYHVEYDEVARDWIRIKRYDMK